MSASDSKEKESVLELVEKELKNVDQSTSQLVRMDRRMDEWHQTDRMG
jgi:hypothetical protein